MYDLNIKRKVHNSVFYLSIFFSSWGIGIQNVESGVVNVSKIFPIMAIIFIMLSFIGNQKDLSVYSKALKVFFIYLIIHTIISQSIFGTISLLDIYVPIYRGIRVDYMEASFIRLLRVMLFILYFFFASRFMNSTQRISKAALIYTFGLSLMIIYSTAVGGVSLQSRSGILRYAGGFFDPNSLGYFCMIGIVLNIGYILEKRIAKAKTYVIFASLLMSIQLYGILMSGSRSAFLGLLAGLLFILLRSSKNIRRRNVLLFLVVAFWMAILIAPDSAIDMVLKRSNVETMLKQGGSGRVDIWLSYLTQTDKYIIKGVGLMRSSLLNSGGHTCHNTYLTVLVELGFIGLVAYLLGMMKLFKTLISRRMKGIINVYTMIAPALLISLSINNFFIDAFSMRAMWIALAVVVSISHQYKSTKTLPAQQFS
jgi:O-antigen ligase